MKPSLPLLAVLMLFHAVQSLFAAPAIKPLVMVVDLDVGEEQNVTLSNGVETKVKLLDLEETRDPVRQAVRTAEVSLLIDGQPISLQSGMYNLPQTIGKVQVDCSVTSGLNSNGTPSFWGLDKAARIRLWPANSPLIRPGTFAYPVEQRWFATGTWFDNEPVDGGTSILPKIYYHSGLDIGGAEGLTQVVAATDGLVVSTAGKVLEGHESKEGNSPVAERYDLVYLLDDRGWYYRYSHLDSIDPSIKLGQRVKKGDPIGILGKEGASGGWAHLHFEIKARQPSGKWGTQAGYGFLRQAYIDQYRPKVLANARPGMLLKQGESTILDGSRSWAASGKIKKYEWRFTDGASAEGSKVKRSYEKPGCFQEVLKVTDSEGNVDYDFVTIRVLAGDPPRHYPHNLHAAYWPTFGIKPRDAVTFKVRAFFRSPEDDHESEEVWDFGDGSPPVHTRSDGGRDGRALNGYAVTQHRYEKAGHYLVTVRRKFSNGQSANYHLQVRVGEQ